MQLLQDASKESSAAACAREVLACVPTVMQYVRAFSQRRRAKSLSVQQFRALGIVQHRGGLSLSDLAEQLGLAVASTSRLVDGLVRRGCMSRTPMPGNRRQVRLSVRAAGNAILADTLAHTHQALAERLATLTDADRDCVSQAMRLLLQTFDCRRDSCSAGAAAAEEPPLQRTRSGKARPTDTCADVTP